MEKSPFLLIALLILLAGCGTASKAYRVMDPKDINKDNLSKASAEYSPKYRIPFVKTKGVDQSIAWWGKQIDKQYAEYASCVKQKFKKDANLKKLRTIKIIVVADSKFECKYHKGRCSGEYDPGKKIILVSRKDFNKSGFVPLLKHEWSHANGILQSNHSNHSYVKKCTKY